MMEAAEGKFPPASPTAKENQNKYGIETFKLVPIIISAFPALFLSDPRYIFFVSFTLFPAVLFLLSYFLCYSFTKHPWYSFGVGLIMVFWYGAWAELGRGSILILSNLFYHYPLEILNISHIDIGCLNNNFRFINLSVTGPILMALILSLVLFIRERTWPRFFLSLMLLSAIAFTYIPQMIFSYAILACFILLSLIRKNRGDFWSLFLVGIFVAVYLLTINYPDMVRTCSFNTNFLANLFTDSHNTMSLWARIKAIRPVDKYIIFWIIALVSSWKMRELRDWIIVLIAIGLSFKLINLLSSNPTAAARFFVRAYDQVWILFLLISLFFGFRKIYEGLKVGNWAISRIFCKVTGVVIIVGVITIPTLGLTKHAIDNTRHLAYYIPDKQWQAYVWLKAHTEKDTVVVAMDWNDVYLVPIYTRNKIFFGHYILDNRSEVDEVGRYLTAWHLLGLPRKDLEKIVVKSVDSYTMLDFPHFSTSNFPTADVQESGLFTHSLIYYPYLTKLAGRDIGSPEFVRYIMDWYDGMNWRSALEKATCDYILVSNSYFNRANSLDDRRRFELVYNNSLRRIYRIKR
jgi:hypothetical protein